MSKLLRYTAAIGVLGISAAFADTTDQTWMNKVELTKTGDHCVDDENCFNRYHPAIPPRANANVPPEFASLMPPVSGLLQPTLRRLAFEKFEPANGPAEKISGLSGDSGSTFATPRSNSVLAIRYRPARITASPSSFSVSTDRSSRLMCRCLRMSGILQESVAKAPNVGNILSHIAEFDGFLLVLSEVSSISARRTFR